ncbi:MAG: glycosyltransferase family 2 protein [Acidobacteriota bacterium]
MEKPKSTLISLVIPVFNEGRGLEQLYREVEATVQAAGLQVEIVFVDDGSSDETWPEISRLANADSRVMGIKFRKNFGKSAALNAGFKAARGEILVTLDSDLQDDPAEIPKLLAKLDEGYDLVSGWKKRRFDPWHKVIPSRIFNWLVGVLSGLKLHDHNCGLKAYRVQVVREIVLYGELHRFATLMALARGFRVTENEVRHRPRVYGHSKYGALRFVKGLLDLLTVGFLGSFSHRPLHLLGGVGLFAFALGGSALAYLAGLWLAGYQPLGQRPILIYAVAALLLGAQMLTIGILAELITSRLASLQGLGQTEYSITEQVGRDRKEETEHV